MPRSRGTHRAASKSAASVGLVVERIDAVCRLTVAGKLAARDLTTWVREFAVNESEFRLLWLLYRPSHTEGAQAALDQAELAERLAVSAAQVSGTVERLRARQLIASVRDSGDRRRQLWRLAAAGRQLVQAVVSSVDRKSECSANLSEEAA